MFVWWRHCRKSTKTPIFRNASKVQQYQMQKNPQKIFFNVFFAVGWLFFHYYQCHCRVWLFTRSQQCESMRVNNRHKKHKKFNRTWIDCLQCLRFFVVSRRKACQSDAFYIFFLLNFLLHLTLSFFHCHQFKKGVTICLVSGNVRHNQWNKEKYANKKIHFYCVRIQWKWPVFIAFLFNLRIRTQYAHFGGFFLVSFKFYGFCDGSQREITNSSHNMDESIHVAWFTSFRRFPHQTIYFVFLEKKYVFFLLLR